MSDASFSDHACETHYLLNEEALFRRGCAWQILAKRELHASDVYQARFGPVVLGNSRQSLMVAGVTGVRCCKLPSPAPDFTSESLGFQCARKDLLQAAKLEPQNRQARRGGALKEVKKGGPCKEAPAVSPTFDFPGPSGTEGAPRGAQLRCRSLSGFALMAPSCGAPRPN